MRPAIFGSLLLSSLLTGCVSFPATTEHQASLPRIQLDGYPFHVKTFGNPRNPPVIVVHGGPGGDLNYLLPMQAISDDFFVIFYDQRGTGLSPRTQGAELTFEQNLNDLHMLASHYAGNGKVKMIGHSWGAMLTIAYLGEHPHMVSHAVAVEPGILSPASAEIFVKKLKESQSVLDALPLLGYVLQSAFIKSLDDHERFDYVMTKLMNRSKPGKPYQCEGQAMPPNAFMRAGYAAFKSLLKPILDDPSNFHWDLTKNIARYHGPLLMISSECSFIGYEYQAKHHIPSLPSQATHVLARGMGHNMLSLNAGWSSELIKNFLKSTADAPNQ